MRSTLSAYLPLVVWAAGVLVVGSLDYGEVVPLPSGTDKAGHFVLYGFGGALSAWAAHRLGSRHGWIGLVFVALVAATDELRQRTLPHRHGDPMDWVADVLGALTFFALARWLLRRNGTR